MKHLLFAIPIGLLVFAAYMANVYPSMFWVSLLVVFLIDVFVQLPNKAQVKWKGQYNISVYVSAILSASVLLYGV